MGAGAGGAKNTRTKKRRKNYTTSPFAHLFISCRAAMSLNTFSFKPLESRKKIGSLEQINPSVNDPNRVTDLRAAIFNLVSTVVGGGVLSLPFAYATTGILLTSVYVGVAAAMAAFSLYILCSCSRRTGAVTYPEVIRVSFGPGVELAAEFVLAIFLFFVTTGYMVLIRDINTGLAQFFVPGAAFVPSKVLLYTLLVCFPCMLLKSLHSLRFNCYLGFASVLTLLVSMIYRSYKLCKDSPERLHSGQVLIYTDSPYDGFFSFPLVALAFLSQFNMLSVHASLKDPTRNRLITVIFWSVLTCTFIFLLFGTSGYMYALGETKDNILLNFDPNDTVILAGKVGLSVTLMAGISMIVLPCRDAVVNLPRKIKNYHNRKKLGSVMRSCGESRPLIESRNDESFGSFEKPYEPKIYNDDDEEDIESLGEKSSELDLPRHVLITFGIATAGYLCACYCPGVSTVWSICGSSLGFIIAYILPSACYLKIRGKKKGLNRRVVGAWVMLVVSILGMTLCSIQAVWRIIGGGVKTRADEFVKDFYNHTTRHHGDQGIF